MVIIERIGDKLPAFQDLKLKQVECLAKVGDPDKVTPEF